MMEHLFVLSVNAVFFFFLIKLLFIMSFLFIIIIIIEVVVLFSQSLFNIENYRRQSHTLTRDVMVLEAYLLYRCVHSIRYFFF